VKGAETRPRQPRAGARRSAIRAWIIVGGVLAAVLIGGWLMLSYLP
jgi:hypothetical protein